MPRGIDITGQGISFMMSLRMEEFTSEVHKATSGFEDMEKSFNSMRQELHKGMEALTLSAHELGAALREMSGGYPTEEEMRAQLEFLEDRLRLMERYRKGLIDVEKETDDLGHSTRRWKEELHASDKASDSLLKTMTKLKGLAGAIGISIGVKEAAEELVELESTAFNIRQIAGNAGRSVADLIRESITLSEKSTDTVKNVQSTMEILTRAGVTTKEQFEELIPTIQRMGLVHKTASSQIAQTAGDLTRVLGLSTEQVKELLGAVSTFQNVKVFGTGTFDNDLRNLNDLQTSVLRLGNEMRRVKQDDAQATRHQVDAMKDAVQMQRRLQSEGLGEDAGAMTRRALSIPSEWLEEKNLNLLAAAGVSGIDVWAARADALKGDLEATFKLYERVLNLAGEGKLAGLPESDLANLLGDLTSSPKAAAEALRKSLAATYAEAKKFRETNLPDNLAKRWKEYQSTVTGMMNKIESDSSRVKARLAVMFEPMAKGALTVIDAIVSAFDKGSEKMFQWMEKLGLKGGDLEEKLSKASKALFVGAGVAGLLKATRDLRAAASLYDRTLHGKRGGGGALVTVPTGGGSPPPPPQQPGIVSRTLGGVGGVLGRGLRGAGLGSLFGLWDAFETYQRGDENSSRAQMVGEMAGNLGGPALGGAVGGLVGGPIGAMIGAGIMSVFGREQAAEFGRGLGVAFEEGGGAAVAQRLKDALIEGGSQAASFLKGVFAQDSDFWKFFNEGNEMFGDLGTGLRKKWDSWWSGERSPEDKRDLRNLFVEDRERIREEFEKYGQSKIDAFTEKKQRAKAGLGDNPSPEAVEQSQTAMFGQRETLRRELIDDWMNYVDKMERLRKDREELTGLKIPPMRQAYPPTQEGGEAYAEDMLSGRGPSQDRRYKQAPGASPLEQVHPRNPSDEASGASSGSSAAPGPQLSSADIAEGNRDVVAAVRDLKETILREGQEDRQHRERMIQIGGGDPAFAFPFSGSRNFSNQGGGQYL